MTNLRSIPLIPPAPLARAHGVGTFAVNAAASRIGIEPARMANNRTLFTFEQAQAVARELSRGAGA